jgi:hypothetical protein
MKVGVISLMTVFLIALPLAAFGGTDPCPSPDDDTDGDTVCDVGPPADNCIDTPNTDQSDIDSDGQGDVCDNCISAANGPAAGPYPGRDSAGALTPGHQCDTNADGYGNACDVDIDNNGLSLSGDYTVHFKPASAAGVPPGFVWVANAVGGTLADSRAQEVDMDCNNFKVATDYTAYFKPQAVLGPFMAGRSGVATGTPGCCPP